MHVFPPSSRFLQRAPLAQAVLLAFLTVAVAPHTLAQPLDSKAQAPARYTIPAGTLDQVLNRFAASAGILLAIDGALTMGKTSQGLSGTYGVAEGLNRILRGTGLAAVPQPNGGYTLVKQSLPAPPPSPPTAQSPEPAVQTLPEVRAVAAPLPPAAFTLAGQPGTIEPGIVTAQTIAQHAVADLEDLFAGQPEVSVGGGHGIAQKIYVRGIEDTLVNVTIDGAGLAGQAFHHTGRVQIEPELLKQVEIRAGTGDATAGPGALGGVLRFVTKDPEDLLRPGESAGAFTKAAYYSNAEGFKLHASVFGRFSETWSGLAALTHQDLDDYEDGDGNTVIGSGARQELGFLKLVGKPATGHTVRLSYDRHTDDGLRAQRPQWIVSGFNRAYPLESVRDTWNLGYAWDPASPLVKAAFNLYRTDTELEQNVIGRWGLYQGRVKSLGLDLRNTSVLDRHVLTYGIDYRRDRITAGPAVTPNAERESGRVAGVFVQDDIALTPKLDLSLGARYDRYSLTDANNVSFSEGGLSPNASLRYAVTPNLALLAGHARALRGPKVRDAFKLDIITNDPNLQPERSRTTEIGFEYVQGPWRFNGKAYRTTISDVIADPIGNPARYMNVGELLSRGALLHTTYDWKRLRIGAGFLHNRATLNGRRLNVYEHNGLGASQGNTLTASLDWLAAPGLEFGWLGRFVQGIDTIETSVGPISKPGYAVHDVYTTWRPQAIRDLAVTFSIHNLFDKSYLDHASNEDFQQIPGYAGIVGSREPGREFRLVISKRF